MAREESPIAQATTELVAGQRLRRLGRGMGRFVRTQPLGTLGLVLCIIMVLAGIFAPWVAPYDPLDGDAFRLLQAPSTSYWFGTDNFGRDLYSRLVFGARISFFVSFFAIAIGTTLGYFLGIMSGYFGGLTDDIMQRFVDAVMSFPSLLLALAMVSVLGGGLDKTIIAISITFFPRATRVARGTALSVKESVYIDAARVIGASPLRIMLRHILPNSMAPWVILASVNLGAAILIESSLSFLGLGVPPPHASWGRELSGAAAAFATTAPWLMIFPGLAIMTLVLGFNLFGDALRDIWDPKLRGR